MSRISHKEEDLIEVPFGKGRKAHVTRLSMGDQFDLAMAVPNGMTGLASNLAIIAASVVKVDGVPYPAISNRNGIRIMLDMLGEDGAFAVNQALSPPEEADATADAEAAQKARVGNLPETPTSGG